MSEPRPLPSARPTRWTDPGRAEQGSVPLALTRRLLDLQGRSAEPADLLVLAQGLALAGLLWPGRGRWKLPRIVRSGALAVTATGSVVGGAGLVQLGGDVTPRVEPRDGVELRTGGVYAVSRNPVYAGLLLGGMGFAVLRRRREPLLAATVLAGVLHLKVLVEERRLRARYGERYDHYARRTPRLIGLPRRDA